MNRERWRSRPDGLSVEVFVSNGEPMEFIRPRPAGPVPRRCGGSPRRRDAAHEPMAVLYRMVRLFRAALAERGRPGWKVARCVLSRWLEPSDLQFYAASLVRSQEVISLDIDVGVEAPVLHRFDGERETFAPDHVLYLLSECALFRFTLLDYTGDINAYLLAAAPDLNRLNRTLTDLEHFCVDGLKDSDELLVTGPYRIPIDRSLTWNDPVLPPALRDEIRANVEGFFRGRVLYDRMRLPYKRGFLFTGPPGNGKTLLCRVIASQASVPCLYLLGSDQEDQKDEIGTMFRRAARLAPCVLIFEDIDHLFEGRGLMSYFLNLMDGFKANDGLLVLGTTNHPEDVDPALLNRPSRFDRVWKIDLPGPREREAYLGRLFAGHLEPEEVRRLARATDRFSCAYLKELYVSAAQEALREATDPAGADLRVRPAHVDRVLPRLREQMEGNATLFENTRPVGFSSVGE